MQKFRWEHDDEESQRQEQVTKLYKQGFKWWEIGQLLPAQPPEKHNDLEARIIEEMETIYHQEFWTDQDWKILYNHSVSQNSVKPTQW